MAVISTLAKRIKNLEAKLPDVAPEKLEEATQRLGDLKRNFHLKLINKRKTDELTKRMDTNLEQGVSDYNTIKDVLSEKAGVGSPYQSVEGRANALYTRFSAPIFELKDSLRTKWAGFVQDTDLADDMIRILDGGKVKNKQNEALAKQIAKQWQDVSENIRLMRNKYGARIGKLDDWVMPQTHTPRLMKIAGKEQWMKDIKPLLDIERSLKTLGKDDIDEALGHIYDSITIPKLNDKTKGGMLAKKQEFERKLHFKKGGEARIKYNSKYGNKDIFASMDGHIRGQANDIAMLQIMGSDPDAVFQTMKEKAYSRGTGKTSIDSLDRYYNTVSGRADGDDIVDTVDTTVATIGGGHRAIMVGSKLGSAAITAIGDMATIVIGAGYRGLSSPKIFGRALLSMLEESFSGTMTGATLERASRLGVVSEFASASMANTRFAELSTGWFQRRAENVIRASGLSAWTTTWRAGFGLELIGNLFDMRKTKFSSLKIKGMLEEYGITSKEWDIIRKIEPLKIKDGSFLDIEGIYKVNEELGYKVSGMISSEMDAFVINPTSRTRVWTTAGMQKGTVGGEVARNLMLFKSFPVTITMMHLNRFRKIDSVGGKAAYTAGAITTSVIFGQMALWAYDMIKGETPRDITAQDPHKIITEALLKGGGLGIFGDFFLADNDRFGHSLAVTAMGVPAGTIGDIGKTIGDFKDVAFGEKDITEKFIPNAFNRARRYIPGQNLWYTRLAMDRYITNQVQRMIDPDYYKKVRRLQRNMRKRNQKYWWRKGELTPDL